jgi:hypothetical protein
MPSAPFKFDRKKSIRFLSAIIPLSLVLVLVFTYNCVVQNFILCESGNCAPVTNNLNNVLVPDNPAAYEVLSGESNEDKLKKDIKKYERDAARYGGRFKWLFLGLVYLIVSIMVLVVSCAVIYKSFADKSKQAIIGILIIITFSFGFGCYLYNNPELYMSVLIPIFNITIKNDLKNITELMTWLNSICFAVIFPVVCAVYAILYSSDNDKPYLELSPLYAKLNYLYAKMKYLQLLLYIGTIMLIFGILLIQSMYDWSLAFILRDEQAIKVAGNFYSNLLIAEGGFFTLILAAIYLPAAILLRMRASVLKDLPEDNLAKEKLLKDYNLSFSFTESLPRLLAISSPLLVGPIGELFSAFSK